MPTPIASTRSLKRFTTDCSGTTIALSRTAGSTTIQLFSEIFRGVGRNRLDGARKKRGLKVHALMDAFSGVIEFIRITEAREHDRKFLYHLKLVPNSWIVFEGAYATYNQFTKWADQKTWFVTLKHGNGDFHVTKVLADKTSYANLLELIKNSYKAWTKTHNASLTFSSGKSKIVVQSFGVYMIYVIVRTCPSGRAIPGYVSLPSRFDCDRLVSSPPYIPLMLHCVSHSNFY